MYGVIVFSGFQLLDAAGPISTLEIAGRIAGRPSKIKILATRPGEVQSSSGVSMLARGFRSAAGIETLIVADGEGVREAIRCEQTINFIRKMATRGHRIASVCSGAYLLAQAGVLDGRRATTHWRRSAHFQNMFPNVRLEPDQIYVRDGNIWSSAGISAGIDLALALAAEDFGEAVAKETARQLVVYDRRSGGQSQFSTLLELRSPDSRFGPLLVWARENLDQPLTVDQLADRVAMSPRHFTRAFTAETKNTPSKAIERLRIEAARHRVQTSGEAIEQIAASTGFRDPERMRRAFIRVFGQPPQALRRTARGGLTTVPSATP